MRGDRLTSCPQGNLTFSSASPSGPGLWARRPESDPYALPCAAEVLGTK
jgi:hypothetical protein